MPDNFKALASITTWILFILGCLLILMPSIMGTIGGMLFKPGEIPPINLFVAIGIGVVSLILSVCAMVLRRKLE